MTSKVRPIKPDDVVKAKKEGIPDAVFEAFNELIVQKFNGRSATVKQDDVVALLVAKGLNRNDIFEKHWLDVEDVYRADGWKVEYNKPAYNEDYPATFTFKRNPKR